MRKECFNNRNGRGEQNKHVVTTKKALSLLSPQIRKDVLMLVDELDLECVGVTTINNDNENTNN